MSTSTVQISGIYLVRPKRLKSGKTTVRSMRRITGGKTTQVKLDGIIHLTFEFDDKWAVGTLMGILDTDTGNFSAELQRCELRGYLKGRDFQMTGYDLTARQTSVNRRAAR